MTLKYPIRHGARESCVTPAGAPNKKVRSRVEIAEKIAQIRDRVRTESNLEVATRATCEIDALEWCLGYDVPLHDL